jgi:intraflagellar transport protein 172
MQLRFLQAIQTATTPNARISTMAWSPNGQKLAVAGQDRVVVLYDDAGDKKDKFATKTADAKVDISPSVCL